MRAGMSVRFSKPVDLEKDYISVGSFSVKANGALYQFDFHHVDVCVDTEDPTIVYFSMKDIYCIFPSCKELERNFHKINEVDEFYIFTGEPYEKCVTPAEVLNFVFDYSIEANDTAQKINSTDYLDVEYIKSSVGNDLVVITFKDVLLKQALRYLEDR